MKVEFLRRIFTSIILLPILFFATLNSGNYLLVLLILFFCLSIYEIIQNTKNLLFIFLSSFLLILSFYSFYYLRGDNNYSLTILFWILCSTFLSDIGGYTFGKIFKGKKLSKISPNKTYSGSIGSIILSSTSLFLINFFQLHFLGKLLINFLEIKFLLITTCISIVCQLGDLFVSFLKRKIKIKNISNILPGHGGVLDRIDGLIFVLLFCSLLKILRFI
ncbi:MAG: phosphatidate cytidylyltransferase [Pelagibacteraceae bacterium]|mgnify:CR=1 FL=1|jgi:phosphatidate cytidylyltransferase|nr:phosphatidate cytidylyltransferase [Pelagibacteraceae bacterium]